MFVYEIFNREGNSEREGMRVVLNSSSSAIAQTSHIIHILVCTWCVFVCMVVVSV